MDTIDCKDCLADCSHTIYQSSLTAQPFKKCTEKNFGLSLFCNIYFLQLLKPQMWADEVLQQYPNDITRPIFLSDVVSSTRTLTSSVSMQKIFTKINRTYDAYDEDIAVLNVYFDKPTLIQFETRASQTWTNFLSNVGGILGLCIGLSIVSIAEILWLFIGIISKVFNLSGRIHSVWKYIKGIFSRRYNENKVDNEEIILD